MSNYNENENSKTAKEPVISVRTMTKMAMVAAVFCVLGPLSIPIPISPVPISLTNFVAFICVFVLEWKQAAVSYLLYLLIGLIGLPVFSGFSGGLGKFAGPTGGYLIGMIILIVIAGLFLKASEGKNWRLYYALGAILGETIMYVIGTGWLCKVLSVSFMEGLFMGVIPYLPGDAAKLIIALIIGKSLRRIR